MQVDILNHRRWCPARCSGVQLEGTWPRLEQLQDECKMAILGSHPHILLVLLKCTSLQKCMPYQTHTIQRYAVKHTGDCYLLWEL